MSMLTPPGMGGKYRITGDKYPRMRQRRRRGRLAVTVVASAAALGLLGWGTLQLIDVFTGGGDKASAAGSKAACASPSPGVRGATTSVSVPKPGQITVNVYNATARSGLAKDTADALKKRGFKIGDVGNASKEFDKKVKGSGILLGPSSALKTSLPVLGTQLSTAEQRAVASRKGAELDLIVGDGFKALTPKAAADKALALLAKPASATASTKKSC
ncbi:LytR C-terminal domain-containing protein [Streptomyces sp. NPDC088794]|uniref:LytR C-terminal domain-containing protein n=1 Tax=Streptomyces sp. NPDC088794 TaxID=3365902 RepID=UPI003823C53A